MNTEIIKNLNNSGITYRVIKHNSLGDVKTALDFARLLGVNPSAVAKTLFIKNMTDSTFLFVILSTEKT